MADKPKLYKVGMSKISRNHHAIVFQVLDQIWTLMSCSLVSGQMSIKNETENFDHTAVERFERTFPLPNDWATYGVTNDGMFRQARSSMKQVQLLNAVRDSLPFLGMRLGRDPFITVETRCPVVSDGRRNYELQAIDNGQNRNQFGVVNLRVLDAKKYYKVIVDPIQLDFEGCMLTPISRVLSTLEDNVAVLADPFAARNTARKPGQGNEVKTIRPGLRQKMRKIEVSRRMAQEVINVDDFVKEEKA